MKAEDTVMKDAEVKKELRRYFTEEDLLFPELMVTTIRNVIAIVRQVQAKISFRMGIQEVADYLADQWDFEDDEDTPYYVMSKKVWQAQLEKWEKANPKELDG